MKLFALCCFLPAAVAVGSSETCDMTTATDEDALRAMRAASPALQKWWLDGQQYLWDGELKHNGVSPRSWKGVTWRDGRVQELSFWGSNHHLNLGRCELEELPPQIGQLTALTRLDLGEAAR